MPIYLLYFLQPFNIGCFLLLKRIYNIKILALVYYYITHITKIKFLPTFKIAFKKIFIKDTIKEAFRGASLILYNLNIIILKLNVRLCTPN